VTDLHRSTPAELKARLEAERKGVPFLVYFDGAGGQVLHELPAGEPLTIGRSAECDVGLAWDREVSRVHAQLERVGSHWVLVDDDRLCFGETPVVYRAAPTAGASSTISVPSGAGAAQLTPTQKKILVALCRPVRDSAFATPSTNREIAEEVSLSVDAVKAHLRTLFERFGLADLPQNQKRARLAATALLQGVVTHRD
jgi:hypothetical protein